MNNFCLGDSLHDEFEIEVVFVSKKKKKENCTHVFIKAVDIL